MSQIITLDQKVKRNLGLEVLIVAYIGALDFIVEVTVLQ